MAQTFKNRRLFYNGGAAPAWVHRVRGDVAGFDLDLKNNRAWFNRREGVLSDVLTCTRSGDAWYIDNDGLLTQVSANVLRHGSAGLLVEQSSTNVVLYNRDLTNAAWTKSNCTAAKDQTGLDGVSNSASSLEATSGNATCLQSITLASSARWQSAFVKRITGTGTIEMTMDNGTTWTAVTLTSSWARVEIPTQTLANPTVGFRIVTSGDKIAIDLVQNEDNAVQATSPIVTTSASVTRSADVVAVDPTRFWNRAGVSIFCMGYGNTPNATPCAMYGGARDTTGVSVFYMAQNATAFTCVAQDDAAANQFNVASIGTDASLSNGVADKNRHRLAIRLAPDNYAACNESLVLTTDTSGSVPNVRDVFRIGARMALTNTTGYWNGYIERFCVWQKGLDNEQLRLLAVSLCDFFLLTDGDSITQTPSAPLSVHNKIRSTFAGDRKQWGYFNCGIGGSSIGHGTAGLNIASSARQQTCDNVIARVLEANPGIRHRTLVIVGHNDVDEGTAANHIIERQAYFAARKTAKHLTIEWPIPPSTTPAGTNTFRATVNADIAANGTTYGTEVFDPTGVYAFDDADGADTAKYPDGIHPASIVTTEWASALYTEHLLPASTA